MASRRKITVNGNEAAASVAYRSNEVIAIYPITPLYRFDPRRVAAGQPPLQLDSGAPKASVAEYMRNETRFRMVEKQDPERFKRFLAAAIVMHSLFGSR